MGKVADKTFAAITILNKRGPLYTPYVPNPIDERIRRNET